jgi:hypothetical protein
MTYDRPGSPLSPTNFCPKQTHVVLSDVSNMI